MAATRAVIGAAIGAGADVALQLATNGGRLECIDKTQVLVAAVAGALGQGEIFKLAKFERIAANLEELMGGIPKYMRTPKGADQWIGPNGTRIRSV